MDLEDKGEIGLQNQTPVQFFFILTNIIHICIGRSNILIAIPLYMFFFLFAITAIHIFLHMDLEKGILGYGIKIYRSFVRMKCRRLVNVTV